MIVSGVFPFTSLDEELDLHDTPRVGDGVITIGADTVVTYGSPNAVSALHKLGMVSNLEGRAIGELIPGSESIVDCFETQVPSHVEVEARREEGRIVVALRSLPLLEKGVAVGAVVLLRDVSDLRRRDRLLDNKDATIREVHHRVKNNLQTISALLRLQGRRLESAEAKQAIEESVRRIRTIALVHETLSRDVRDAVPFDDIVRPLVRMVEEGLASPDRPLKINVTGALGDLPPETATPLAVVLTELLQNSLEHGYPNGTTPKNPGRVEVLLANDSINLSIDVRDNGIGLPEDFSLSGSRSLGLSIVRSLVTTELGGVIAFRNDEGTVVQLRIPREADPRAR
jgi:two-component system, sensor histidine kinase PdtaS